MNILYAGKYKKRFFEVIKLLKGLPRNCKITELCFGDTYIADYCKKNNLRWVGIDLNPVFVKEAQRKGFLVIEGNIYEMSSIPAADVCLMMGSLYHFKTGLKEMIVRMFLIADTVIISEPVRNLSSSKGIIGYIARRSANAGKGQENFRFTETSLLNDLERLEPQIGFKIDFKKNIGKDLIIKLTK